MKLGILGGTFDPIHFGHILMAQAALDEVALDRVLLLPGGDPPHKTPYAPKADRLYMVRLAADTDERFWVSDMELKRAGRTYTVDTLLQLRDEYPHAQLTYIVGSDTLMLFPSWKDAERVATLCDMAVVLRPGDSREAVQNTIAQYHETLGLHAVLLRFTGPDISSTAIRSAAQTGLPLDGLVPEAVAGYIRDKGLYRRAG
jgi:nicotinate-nucleotide adenylyltransferase